MSKLNIPNKLSIVRICLIPLIVFFYLAPLYIPELYSTGKIIALVLFIIAVFTDFLDGWIARKYNMVTNLGKLLDPMADKMLTTAGLVLLLSDYEMLEYIGILWLVVVVAIIAISRDFLNGIIRQLGAEKGKIIAAVWSGKIRTNVMYFTTFFMMFLAYNWTSPFMTFDFEVFWIYICTVGLLASIGFNIYSAIDYTMKNKEIFADINKELEVTETLIVETETKVVGKEIVETVKQEKEQNNTRRSKK